MHKEPKNIFLLLIVLSAMQYITIAQEVPKNFTYLIPEILISLVFFLPRALRAVCPSLRPPLLPLCLR